ncbi:hypothetical protein PP175_08415 [Aneurinibacillus sp. Ricciae_BoGa-3]|uniref:hypothetical protein n=1 Tax=Aneurinibacillus sp. Ricciae_BoGa-3 TaxID=3022697 RepID=UPI00233FB5A8|nr:hypothetical protein [Aneurinibacillus sp. Ricciae_BoGa-3]WCK55925.1 hypothetical protein PP175_08415 [Aneurinibacillus sp. Ricciae_BoGa-3]
MVKQFLRRIFSSRGLEEEAAAVNEPVDAMVEDVKIEKQDAMEWQRPGADEPAPVGQTAPDWPLDSPLTLIINRDKIEKHNYKEAIQLVADVFQNIEQGLRRSGRVRLSLDAHLVDEMDEFLGRRLGKYIEQLEQQTYDLTAFIDWEDDETVSIYEHFVLPSQSEKQDDFFRSRLILIYDTCGALEWDYQPVARRFAQALGFVLPQQYFVDFEVWLGSLDKAEEDQAANKTLSEKPENVETAAQEPDFTHMIPFQISREEVENEDINKFERFFNAMTAEEMERKKGKIVFSFYGFAGEVDDLVNNRSVNSWASLLIEKYPHIFYFLNDEYVPMTSFLTSLVVTANIEGEEIHYNEEELAELSSFIGSALQRVAELTGEDGEQLVREFESKLHAKF